jgi:hypothetical protein
MYDASIAQVTADTLRWLNTVVFTIHDTVHVLGAVAKESVTDRFLDPFAWLTALTALLALWIAFQQHRASRAKLRLDLFEKRFRVYESLLELLGAAERDGQVKLEDIFRFSGEISYAPFLFGHEVVQYLAEVRTKAIILRGLNERLQRGDLPVGEERSAVSRAESETLIWLTDQFRQSVPKFEKYLGFKMAY